MTKILKEENIPLYASTPTRDELLLKHGNTSSAIRFLHKEGYPNGKIAYLLNIRFQHVYNVLHQITKK